MQSPPPEPARTGPPRRRKRWPRLSLRSAMVLILIIGLPVGWKARRASIQRRAVAAIAAMGGYVTYEHELDQRGFPGISRPPPGPAWLRRLIGDEFFREVAWINLDNRQPDNRLDDESIASLLQCDRLQGLTIHGPHHPDGESPTRLITAAGLAQLDGLSRLRVLHLFNIGTDAAMMALLPRWQTLEDVTIRDRTRTIPGSSLANLARLPYLQVAVVTSVESCRPADLTPLANLPHLGQLIIEHSPQDDREAFTLGGRGLTDASIPLLVQHTHIYHLVLAGTGITDAGVAGLAAFPALS